MADLVFEWDDAKAQSNLLKHGVDFATATEVFADSFGIENLDTRGDAYGELRLVLTGMGGGSLLTIVYTERGESLRIISARRATRREHDDYFLQNSQD